MSLTREQLQQMIRRGEVIEKQSLGPLALEQCDLSGAIFANVTFSGTRLAQATLGECVFNACTFIDVDLAGADLSKSTFLTCELHHANFLDSTLDDCRMLQTHAGGTRFSAIRAARLAFLKCDLSGCRFDAAHIEFGVFDETPMRGADFCARCVSRGHALTARYSPNRIWRGKRFAGTH
jgi:uncharacterized protein YjbI with pentapeptide repeats